MQTKIQKASRSKAIKFADRMTKINRLKRSRKKHNPNQIELDLAKEKFFGNGGKVSQEHKLKIKYL